MKPFSIRLKLEDVLVDEKFIMSVIEYINHKSINNIFIMWYNSDIIYELIDDFKKKWPMVVVTNRSPKYEYKWFDIITQSDNAEFHAQSRFKYFYSTNEELIKGIFRSYNHTVDYIEYSNSKKFIYYKNG